jgi:serine/threonine protein kinase
LCTDILIGLSDLHTEGIICADLKPDNVLMDDHNKPVLSDFGISRAVTGTVGQHMITSVAGTSNYMCVPPAPK